MLYQRNNSPFGRNRSTSSYQYKPLPYGVQGVQAGGLIGKVMGLMAFSFIFAAIGTFVGFQFVTSIGAYWIVALGGLAVLFALRIFFIQKTGINLVLLYLFTFLEGMAISPIIGYYLNTSGYILGEAFLLTALTTLGLSIYAWTTKRDFTRFGDYLFGALILLIVTSLIGLFFHPTIFVLLISFLGVAIFSGLMLYHVQQAKYMADTVPNAIGLTISLFLTILNLFLYILQILAIVQ